jgi:hypothetical protein
LTHTPRTQSALAPLRAATAVIAARARVLPLAPFTKYLSDAQPAGAKPWEGPPVLLMGGAAGPADEQLWVRGCMRCRGAAQSEHGEPDGSRVRRVVRR